MIRTIRCAALPSHIGGIAPLVRATGLRVIGTAPTLRAVAGVRTSELPDGVPHEVIHRDDLVVLPG